MSLSIPHLQLLMPRAPERRARALHLLLQLAALLAMALPGCADREVERLIDDSIVHLQAAERLMTEHAGDEKGLLEAAMSYRAEHGVEFIRLRTRGEALLAKMTEAEQNKLSTQARNRAEPIVARIGLQAQRYPDARKAMMLVRPLIVAGTPRPSASMRPVWMPKEVGPPPALGLPEGITNTRPAPPGGH